MFTKSITGTVTAHALSSATNPQYIDVAYEDKMSVIHLYADYKRYFGEGEYEEGGLYWTAGAGLMLVPYKTTLAEYDQQRYDAGIEDGYSETLSNFTLAGGLGYEKWSDNKCFFGELKLNIPANNENGTVVAIEIPASVSLNAGIRFNLSN